MEQRTRRKLIWSGIGGLLVASALGLAFTTYWYVWWPVSPRWIATSSPWLEPQLRAFAKSQFAGGSDQDARYLIRDNIRKIVVSQGRDAFPALLRCLQTSSPELRRVALEFLKEVPEQEPLSQELVDAVINASTDSDPNIAYEACWCLHLLPREVAKPVWKGILDRRLGFHYRSREHVLVSLVKKGDRDVIPLILPDLHDPSSSMRKFAIFALAEIGDPSVGDEVRKLSDDPDSEVRERVSVFFNVMSSAQGEKEPAPR